MSTAIATREGTAPATLGDSLRPMVAELARSVPNFNIERAIALVNTIAHRSPDLLRCTNASLVASLTQVVSLDLDLAPGRNEAHLVPRWNSGIKGLECSFMPGYKGLEKLATATGVVHYLTPKDVRRADGFVVEHVDEKTHVRHVIDYKADRGPLTHVYTVAKLFDGNITIEVMSVADIEEIHHRSEGWKKAQSEGRPETGPWAKDWLEMAFKTCVKRHTKRLPRTAVPGREAAWTALQAAVDADNVIYPPDVAPAPEPPRNDSGYGRGQYASPERTAAYLDRLESYLEQWNARWLDHWTDPDTGEFPGGFEHKTTREFASKYQADGHLLKWAIETGRLDANIVPEDAKARQLGRYTAIVYHRSKADQKALAKELERYFAELWERKREAVLARNPTLAEWGEDCASNDADPDIDYPDEPGSNG